MEQDGRSRTSTSTVGLGADARCANCGVPFLRNTLQPFHRSSLLRTHRWVVSALGLPRRGCRDGFGEQRYVHRNFRTAMSTSEENVYIHSELGVQQAESTVYCIVY